MNDMDELEFATGQFYTHVACPHCDYENAYEDDVRGDVVECDDCGENFKVV